MPAVPCPAGRDQLSVDDDRTAHIGRTTDFRVELAFGYGGNLLALNDASGCQHLNTVTDRAQRTPCGGDPLNGLDQVLIITEVFGRTPASDQPAGLLFGPRVR